MNNLEIAIKEAYSHFTENKRNTIVFVPKEHMTEALKIYKKLTKSKDNRYLYNKKAFWIAVAAISGTALMHFETMYVINPQDIEDRVIKELRMIPDKTKNTEPMTIAVKI